MIARFARNHAPIARLANIFRKTAKTPTHAMIKWRHAGKGQRSPPFPPFVPTDDAFCCARRCRAALGRLRPADHQHPDHGWCPWNA
ncbi:unnamed protein product [Mycena citricolor]|uniref:Uncharacterized protein n=1 Tax=Mycena citricolor TaxID=2018698 RepID=A0AAD2Q7F5_9AGAR|nr:unnamed protein product [Mycena citricolor]